MAAREPEILGERDDLLERPVVEVEAETDEAALAGGDEDALARSVAVECSASRSRIGPSACAASMRNASSRVVSATRARAASAAKGLSQRSTIVA